MAKLDYAHKMTDAELSKLEQRIAKLYKEAADELTDTVKAYFEQFKKRDAAMKEKLDAGEITEQQYKQWRLAQIGRGKRFEALRDKVAKRYTNAHEVAVAYVNGATPGIYALNRNYAAYTIEQISDKADFTLWDEQTVRRLIDEQPGLMPYYPPKRALKRGIDLDYGKKQITASITSSILQGKSISRIADDMQQRMENMSRASAIRTARTSVTAAQNAGRMDSYHAAEGMGIKLKKEWLATLDGRTRHAHAMLDGQTAETDKPFHVDGYEIMYPGDTSAPGYLVYNCRCTLIAALADAPKTPNPLRRARDPETGKSILVSDMTYAQWESWKKSENRYVWDTYQKKARNLSADQEQYAEYQKVLGKNALRTFAQFQNLKYNSGDGWDYTKQFVAYKRRVPEATETDFQKFQQVKATGVKGIIRVPPEKIDISQLVFRDEHAARHGCTVEEARGYVDNAYCSIRRKRWDKVESINYYSKYGAAYVDSQTLQIKTSYSRKDYKSDTEAIMEVFE
jgi:SPP1 gp7 family putative phage head morphogenesis protein